MRALVRKVEAVERFVAKVDTTEFVDPAAQAEEKIAAIRAILFDKQLAFIDDPHKAKAALKTRRAGGTTTIAADLAITALEGGESGYCTESERLAKRVIWNGRSGLKALNQRLNLGFRFDTSTLTAYAPNGVPIIIGGANTRDACERFRGQAFKKFYIDEPASIKEHLDYLIDEVLEPTLLDEDGTLGLVGTPGRTLAGKFWEITTGQVKPPDDDDADEEARLADWSIHKWGMRDNPHLRHRETFLARIFRRHGWDPANPPARALREYFGLWVREDSTLVYKFSRERNIWDGILPPGHDWSHILSIDLGSVNATAFRIWAFAYDHPKIYGVAAKKETGLTPSTIAERIKGTKAMPWYGPEHQGPVITGYRERFPNIVATVCDAGALGKMIVQELNDRYSLAIQAAEKASKNDFIELMNDDMVRGLILVPEDDPVIPEWETLQWAEDEDKRVEDSRQDNDEADASLYGYRESKHFRAIIAPAPILANTPEWHAEQEQRIREGLERKALHVATPTDDDQAARVKEAQRRQGTSRSWWE